MATDTVGGRGEHKISIIPIYQHVAGILLACSTIIVGQTRYSSQFSESSFLSNVEYVVDRGISCQLPVSLSNVIHEIQLADQNHEGVCF